MTARPAGQIATVTAGILAGLIIGISLADLPTPWQAGCERLSLVSDSDGALTRIVLHYCRDFHEQSVDVFADLLSALSEDTQVTVVVQARSEFDFLVQRLAERDLEAAARLSPMVTGFQITPWSKDRFGTMRSANGKPVIVVPPTRSPMSGSRGNDGKVPGLLADRVPRLSLRTLPFQFDGGDMLCDETYAFISAPMLTRNRPYDVDDRAGLVRRIATTIDRKPILLGTASDEVPDHHIGMVVTPLGNGVVAVADPDLGRAMLNGQPLPWEDVAVEKDSRAYQRFRNVIAMLETAGFRVVRIPMLLTSKHRVYVTYNNALLEQRDNQKRIYMPVYGIPALDSAAQELFSAEGWTVLPVRVSQVFRHTGSLRCLVGVLERSAS